MTDQHGGYQVSGLTDGDYTLTAAGYPPRAKEVQVTAGYTTTADFVVGSA